MIAVPMSPRYFFRIDEIQESQDPDSTVNVSHQADWVPPIESNGHTGVAGGVSGKWWFCDGQSIRLAPSGLPQGAQHHQTCSMYFSDGFGFWVMQGNATRPTPGNAWQPLRFDHDKDDNYSSYLCYVSESRSLLCRRSDQQWPQMLLPDIYRGNNLTPYKQYGALKGELAIFLGLIAFAMKRDRLADVLPVMFSDGAWQTFSMPHGREDGRGVIVYVYTCPATPTNGRPDPTTPSPGDLLIAYEHGKYYGAKYYH